MITKVILSIPIAIALFTMIGGYIASIITPPLAYLILYFLLTYTLLTRYEQNKQRTENKDPELQKTN